MKISDLIDMDLLEDMINRKYINVTTHPTLGYKLYNYSKSCGLDHMWNDATEQCRGLITDADGNIIARPFRKFYNIEEIEDKTCIPNELPLSITEKLDGSLGIMYWDKECNPMIATRGSFESEQAEFATDYLLDEECINGEIDELRNELVDYHIDKANGKIILDNVKFTLLFEIIYPEDRHVVSYGNKRGIVLLAIISNKTGEELKPKIFDHCFEVVKSYSVPDNWVRIREMYNGDNAEGFVVKFKNNFRLKLKYENWFRKNWILNGLSMKSVIELVQEGKINELMKMVNILNEENRLYYKKMYLDLMNLYHEIEFEAYSEYREFETDKEAALYFNKCACRPILFNIRKGKPYGHIIWKIIKEKTKNIQNGKF